jgi:hypothetical protein
MSFLGPSPRSIWTYAPSALLFTLLVVFLASSCQLGHLTDDVSYIPYQTLRRISIEASPFSDDPEKGVYYDLCLAKSSSGETVGIVVVQYGPLYSKGFNVKSSYFGPLSLTRDGLDSTRARVIWGGEKEATCINLLASLPELGGEDVQTYCLESSFPSKLQRYRLDSTLSSEEAHPKCSRLISQGDAKRLPYVIPHPEVSAGMITGYSGHVEANGSVLVGISIFRKSRSGRGTLGYSLDFQRLVIYQISAPDAQPVVVADLEMPRHPIFRRRPEGVKIQDCDSTGRHILLGATYFLPFGQMSLVYDREVGGFTAVPGYGVLVNFPRGP